MQCADGLQFLHACGLLHGDIKPDNIMIQERPRPCLGRRFGDGCALIPGGVSLYDVRLADFGRVLEAGRPEC